MSIRLDAASARINPAHGTAGRKRGGAPPPFLPLLAAVLSGAVGCATSPPELRVTYIANEGVLIAAGPHKVIVDGVFGDPRIDFCDVPTADLLTRIEQGAPPFDEVDLVLVTHAHVDHVSPQALSRFLANNPRCRLVCSGQVRSALQAVRPTPAAIEKRIIVPQAGAPDLDIQGIRVQALALRHAPFKERDPQTGAEHDLHARVEHLAYRIALSGRTILHLGDASVRQNREQLAGRTAALDLVCVDAKDTAAEPLWLLTAEQRPQHILYMHLPIENRQRLIDFLRARDPAAAIFTAPLEQSTFR
jgi:L-ascorbate metabolism protein UlaG (beta-lactamase superfamily)